MKRYQSQSAEQFLDKLIGEDVWVKVSVDLSNGYIEPDIMWLRLQNKRQSRSLGYVYDANYIKDWEVSNGVAECYSVDDYNNVLNITTHIPCRCIELIKPIEMFTTEEFLKVEGENTEL